MVYRALADATVVLHLIFVLYVVLGGLMVLRWPATSWVHVPAVAWGAWIEFAGRVCPLTPLENWLREQGGGPVYSVSFVERYLMPVLYPSLLSRELQWLLGGFVLVINAIVYFFVLQRRRRGHA